MPIYNFYASVHARPEEVEAGPAIEIDGQKLPTLRVPAALMSQPLDRNFEDTVETMSVWPRMFVEPDGSFVWASSQNGDRWQVDGNLYDCQELLQFIDIKGCCPEQEFDRLLGAFGWPTLRLMFQLTPEAVFLEEAEFRRLAQLRGARLPAKEGAAAKGALSEECGDRREGRSR